MLVASERRWYAGTCLHIRICASNVIWLAYDLQLISSHLNSCAYVPPFPYPRPTATLTLAYSHTERALLLLLSSCDRFECVVLWAVCFGNGLFPCLCMMSFIPALHTLYYVNRCIASKSARRTSESESEPAAKQHNQPTAPAAQSAHTKYIS